MVCRIDISQFASYLIWKIFWHAHGESSLRSFVRPYGVFGYDRFGFCLLISWCQESNRAARSKEITNNHCPTCTSSEKTECNQFCGHSQTDFAVQKICNPTKKISRNHHRKKLRGPKFKTLHDIGFRSESIAT